MDPTRFDALARIFGSRASRRSALAMLALTIPEAAAAKKNGKKHGKKKRCKTGQKRCGKKCVRILTDAANCGKCGKACGANLVCQNGDCVAAASVCPAAFTCQDPFGGPAPVCGSVAGGGTCGCYTSTEGNNVCLNESTGGVDIDASTLQKCTSTQDCRKAVGFHFYCRAVTRSPSDNLCGSADSRCWPECDNPNV
ncbi:MAG: hypothetical protein IT337_06100 [Thermomicrobiales bacterium]|nr:hypothetical protein [Thermomicrobiales bacterium]